MRYVDVGDVAEIPYTLVAYFLWWSKPLDVGVPIALPICHLLPALESGPYSDLDMDIRDSGPSRHQQTIRARRASSTMFSVLCRAGYDFAWQFNGRAELGSAVMAILNGGLHATAWLSHFPTPVERTLWRAACVGVALGPAALCAIVWERDLECRALQYLYRLATRDITTLNDFINETTAIWSLVVGSENTGNNQDIRGLPASWPVWCRHLVVVVLVALVVMYAASIMYFVDEAFVSLRSIPASAYRTVAWTNYLPHF